MRKGFIERVILHILNAEGALYPYGIIKAIRRLTFNTYSPSTGAIYPALKNLLNKGLINESIEGNKKVYGITEKGMTAISLDIPLSEHIARMSKSDFPFKELTDIAKVLYENWDSLGEDEHREIRDRIVQFYNGLINMLGKEKSSK